MHARTHAPTHTQVWAGLLSGPRWVVALVNRSPSADDITVTFSDLPELQVAGVPPGTLFTVVEAWTGRSYDTPAASFTAAGVASHDTVLLVVTPKL
jgi:hypothetical protein